MIVGLKLFKWTVLLGLGLFSSMLVLGQDNGQRRLGLRQAVEQQVVHQIVQPKAVAPEALPKPTTEVSLAFAPEKPLIAPPQDASAEEVAGSGSETTLPVKYIAAKRANLRAGPGKNYEIQAKLTWGQRVELVPSGHGDGDWVLVRTDDARGYISASLLTDKTP